MGRVSKYKKVKKVDPFAKKKGRGGGSAGSSSRQAEYVWGTGDNGRREKKRSLRAQRHLARKLSGASEGKRRFREAAGAGGFDLPSGKDDFDLADLMGSIRPEKRPRLDDGLVDPNFTSSAAGVKPSKKKSSGDVKREASSDGAHRSSIPETDGDERRVARILKLGAASSTTAGGGGSSGCAKGGSKSNASIQKDAKSKITGRMEGESMKAFDRRVKEETRLILLEQASGSKLLVPNKEKAQRKKEFLKSLRSKKRRKKGGGGGSDSGIGIGNYHVDDGSEVGFITGERAVAAAAAARARAAAQSGVSSLHDQVERPPTFELLPRGATRKAKNDDNDGRDRRGGGMDGKKIKAEQRAMDALRAKVQTQYALIKQKRKKAGEFHL